MKLTNHSTKQESREGATKLNESTSYNKIIPFAMYISSPGASIVKWDRLRGTVQRRRE